jgi:hypothetical protein
MTLLLTIAQVAAAVNALLLLVLSAVWTTNYRTLRSTQTLGTLVFALFLLAENLLALYYYTVTPFPLGPPAIQGMMYLQILETFGIAFLTRVTIE